MFVKKLNGESGMILFLVISFLAVASVIVAGIFSRSNSSATSSIGLIDQAKAETLAKGILWRAYSAKANGLGNISSGNEILDGTPFYYTVNYYDFSSTNTQISVTVSY